MLDPALANHEGETRIESGMSGRGKGRQVEGVGQGELRVRNHGEWQMQSLDGFVLILGVLAGHPPDMRRASFPEIGEMITEIARLSGAAASAGNRVPPFRKIDARAASKRVEVDDRSARIRSGQVDGLAVACSQREHRHRHSWQVVGGAVVIRCWKIVRQGGKVSHRMLLREGTASTVVPASG